MTEIKDPHEGDEKNLLPREKSPDSNSGFANGTRRPPGFFETIYGVLFEPRDTFDFLGKNRRLSWAFIVFFSVFTFNYLLSIGELNTAKLDPIIGHLLTEFVFLFFILGIVLAFILWFVNTSILNLTALFFGGSGSGMSLFTALSFTQLPLIITSILGFALRLFQASALTGFIQFIGGIWVLALQVIAVSEIQRISTGRAILVYLAPIGFLAALALLVGAAFLAMLGPVMEGLPSHLM